MRKMNAFTLAEVLITLGIIGVVAAMTMPTLMNSTQGAQYKAAYKKALSALSQAVTLNVALDEWSFADLSTNDTNYQMAKMLQERMNVVRGPEVGSTNIKLADGKTEYSVKGDPTGKTKVSTVDTTNGKIAGTNTTLFFNDGIMFTFPTTAAGCTKGPSGDDEVPAVCRGFIDVNGIKAPNRYVQCDNDSATANDCQIKSPTDVYPVIFYDQTVLPNSVAARAVLYSK